MLNDFYVLKSNLVVEKNIFESFLEDIYLSFYRKDRFRHISTADKRFPSIKVTEDTFKLQFYFKDSNGKENYMYFDGSSNFSFLTITSVNFKENNSEFSDVELDSVVKMLRLISNFSDGYLIFEKNNEIFLLESGILYFPKEIISHMIDTKEEERKQSFIDAYSFFE